MTDLIALAERVEKAEGPDRGLDAEIELAIGNWTPEHLEAWSRYEECGEACNPPMHVPVPPQWFTASLDAAMTLVPEGSGMQLHRYWIASVDGPVWYGMVTTSYSSETVVVGTHHHEAWDCRNAALAICAAALRACAALQQKDLTHDAG